MSDVIEDYIRRNPGLSQAQAFDGFLKQDRIRAWVGDDAARRDRLQREFFRIWESMHAAPGAQQVQVHRQPAQAPPPPRPAPPAPPAPAAPPAREEPRAGPAAPAPAPARPAPAAARPEAPRRRLQVLCAACTRYAVFAQGTTVACSACGATYDDMLGLVPVKPVGPFEFVFGEGWQGVATAAGVGLLLLAVYGVLRWV